MRRPAAVWPILAAGCLALASTGCVRPGYVLHGDWSLGLIRSPKLDGQCAADCNGDAGSSGAAASRSSGKTTAAGKYPAGAEGTVVAGHKRCPVVARAGRKAAADNAPGPTGPALGHPRFHPVPVRPVFGPTSAPPQVVPTVAPTLEEAPAPEPERMPPPSPTSATKNPRRGPAVRRGTVQTVSGVKRQSPQ